MSNDNLWQICHKISLDNSVNYNKEMTSALVQLLIRHHGHGTVKKTARDLNIGTEHIRNWFYRNTGMTAFDLLLLIRRYDFIREWALA